MVEVMVGVMEEVMVGVMVEVMMEVMVKVMVVVMIEVMVGIMVGVTVEATALEMADVCSLVLFYLVLCVALSVNVKDIHDALTHLKSSMSTIRIRKSCPVISYSETSRGRIFIVVSISLSMGYVNQVSFIQCTVSATASVSTRLSTAVWCSLQSGRLPCIDLLYNRSSVYKAIGWRWHGIRLINHSWYCSRKSMYASSRDELFMD